MQGTVLERDPCHCASEHFDRGVRLRVFRPRLRVEECRSRRTLRRTQGCRAPSGSGPSPSRGPGRGSRERWRQSPSAGGSGDTSGLQSLPCKWEKLLNAPRIPAGPGTASGPTPQERAQRGSCMGKGTHLSSVPDVPGKPYAGSGRLHRGGSLEGEAGRQGQRPGSAAASHEANSLRPTPSMSALRGWYVRSDGSTEHVGPVARARKSAGEPYGKWLPEGAERSDLYVVPPGCKRLHRAMPAGSTPRRIRAARPQLRSAPTGLWLPDAHARRGSRHTHNLEGEAC